MRSRRLTDRSELGTLFRLMRSNEDIRPVTYLKTRLAELLEQVNDSRRPVIITQNGVARAVVMDPESYDSMRQTIGLLQLIALGEEDVRAGRVVSQKEAFARARRALRAASKDGRREKA